MQRLHYPFRIVLFCRIVFVTIIIILPFVFGTQAFADQKSEHAKIVYLLKTIGSSDLVFICNGDEYTGEEAMDHLQEKMNAAGGRIFTAEDFINYIASESSMTGIPYYVQLPDGTQIEAGIWLRNKLAGLK
jgi:hypothetical protein